MLVGRISRNIMKRSSNTYKFTANFLWIAKANKSLEFLFNSANINLLLWLALIHEMLLNPTTTKTTTTKHQNSSNVQNYGVIKHKVSVHQMSIGLTYFFQYSHFMHHSRATAR